MKVMTIVGTRPEIIRLSRTIRRFDETSTTCSCTPARTTITHSTRFSSTTCIAQTDHFLDVDTSSLGHVLGETLIKTEQPPTGGAARRRAGAG